MIESWKRGRKEGRKGGREGGRKEGRKEGGGGQADIKFNNPHLAGGKNGRKSGTDDETARRRLHLRLASLSR